MSGVRPMLRELSFERRWGRSPWGLQPITGGSGHPNCAHPCAECPWICEAFFVASPCEGDPSFPHAPTSSSDPLRFDRSLFSGPLRHGLLGRRSGVPRAFVPLHGDQLRVHRWRQLHEHLRRELQLRLRHQQHLRRRLRRLLQHRLRDGQRLQHHHRRELERPLRGPDELHGLRRCFEQRPVPGRRGLRCHLHRCVQPRLHRSELQIASARCGTPCALTGEAPVSLRAFRSEHSGRQGIASARCGTPFALTGEAPVSLRAFRSEHSGRQGIASARCGTPFALTGEAPVSLRAFRSEHSGRQGIASARCGTPFALTGEAPVSLRAFRSEHSGRLRRAVSSS
jgi:hypothetical protein